MQSNELINNIHSSIRKFSIVSLNKILMLIRKLPWLAFVAVAMMASCELDSFDSTANGTSISADGIVSNSTAGTLSLTCDISGPTMVSASSTSATYSMTTNIANATYLWEVVQGSALIACPTCPTTTISFPASMNKVKIKCTVTSGDQGCYEIITISRGSGGGGPGGEPCVCPNPEISIFDPYPTDPNKNCNTTSTGLYSFTVTGTSSGDQISWAGNSNVNVQNGQGSTAMAAYIYNTATDFTVTCTVTRTCADGTTFVRTATYSSNISQQCQYYGQYTTGDCGIVID